MVTWNDFVLFAVPAAVLWLAGATVAASRERMFRTAASLTVAGLLVYAAFIAAFWVGLHRPPLRTIGETRLWYSFFMIISGLATYAKWRYRWILLFSAIVATVFIILNLLKPEIHEQSLMPALQSFWFVPHVTVYMFSYSVLGCASIFAMAGMAKCSDRYLPTADRLVYVGMAFLTFGMFSGALWAKDAWGDYWSWDPKETWAAATWCVYLIYIHMRLCGRGSHRLCYILLIFAFICLQMCWYGINYLPSAQGSMHVYGNT